MLLTPPTLARYTVGLLIAVAVAFLMWYFRSIVVYILVSALLAIIFKPLVGRLARLRIRGWHLPRWAAALATLILIWVYPAPSVRKRIKRFCRVPLTEVRFPRLIS